jgi:alpha-tubulin suppressor-like RCC1 family protein
VTTPVPVSGLTGPVTAITAGYGHTCALVAGGVVECWGLNGAGQVGTGSVTTPSYDGAGFPYYPSPAQVALSQPATAISSGGASSTTCAILADTTVACWGANIYGNLGSGSVTGPETCNEYATFACSPTPLPVQGLTGVTAIYVGDDSACAISGGNVWCWGASGDGELGNGVISGPETCYGGASCAPYPVPVTLPAPAIGVAVGAGGACALLQGGATYCWGGASGGGLGNGSFTGSQGCSDQSCTPTPVPVVW